MGGLPCLVPAHHQSDDVTADDPGNDRRRCAQLPSPPAAVEAPVLHRRRFGHRGRTPFSVVMLAGWDQQVKRAVRREVAAMEWYTPQDLPEDVRNQLSAAEHRRAKDLLQEMCVFDDPC